MTAGLVTVVIPIYNVEKYLNDCIESVVNQTYRNLEIILVDDGSSDRCPQICDEWAGNDSRIKVIHKENAGLGMARNTGIENATGEYICFFDSDDYVDLTTIEKAYSLAKKKNAETVLFGINFLNRNGVKAGKRVPKTGEIVYTEEEVREKFLPEFIAPDPQGNGDRLFYMSACLFLYSTDAIKRRGWRFVSEREIISEDVYSLLDLFKDIQSVAILPEALYYYRVNEDSLSRKYKENRFEKIRIFYLETKKLCEEAGYNDEIIHRISEPFISFTIAALKSEITAHIPLKKKTENIRTIIENEILQKVLEENKNNNTGRQRKILFFTMRNKLYFLLYALLWLKTQSEKIM